MLDKLDRQCRDAQQLADKLETRQHADTPIGLEQLNKARIKMALNRTKRPLDEAMRALQKFEDGDPESRGTMDFRGRVRFVMQEDAVQDLLGKVDKALEVLRDVANDVLEQ